MRDLLDALPEPSLVVETGGRVVAANRVATQRFGPALHASGLFDLLTPTLPGARAELFLRLFAAEDHRFSALAEKVRRLNAEIQERRRVQAVLEESLRDRELMLRELHHRVKNSIQMLCGMVSVARREAGTLDAHSVLADISQRLAAVGAVHQILHVGDSLSGLRADRLVAELGTSILRPYGADGRLVAEGVADAAIPNESAVPLALILNELLVNAVKHGGEGAIRVRLGCAADRFELSVEDDGPGFAPEATARRGSGLGLVHGLARQLRGSFAVEPREPRGARCTLRFARPAA
jgi:two-component sensor histidine kinase